jgi:hypothetical protein
VCKTEGAIGRKARIVAMETFFKCHTKSHLMASATWTYALKSATTQLYASQACIYFTAQSINKPIVLLACHIGISVPPSKAMLT